jgi:thioredoxin-dependent peroxiredoxin
MSENRALKVGNKCPLFTLKNQNGESIDIGERIGKQFLLIYFYPKDQTYGCTQQACSFRDAYDEFLNYNCKVFGVSSDSTSSHDRFSNKHNLNFDILSDEQDYVRNELFGVPKNLFGLLKGRVTYLINKEGKICWVFNSQMNATKHISEAIEFLKQLN